VRASSLHAGLHGGRPRPATGSRPRNGPRRQRNRTGKRWRHLNPVPAGVERICERYL
jgi:hypothetical protein